MKISDKILTHEDFQKESLLLFAANIRKAGKLFPPGDKFNNSLKLQAYINQGRWVVNCPFCAGAENVSLVDLRFFCCNCGNEEIGGTWLHVILPKQRMAIERALVKRARLENRNWFPWESVADLQKENKTRG